MLQNEYLFANIGLDAAANGFSSMKLRSNLEDFNESSVSRFQIPPWLDELGSSRKGGRGGKAKGKGSKGKGFDGHRSRFSLK